MKRAIVILSAMAAMVMASQAVRATEFQVDIQSFAFTPHGLHINPGDMITWRNRDATMHTSTSDNGVWSSPNLSQNQTYSFTFSSPGSFPYHCSIHLGMKDTIFVDAQSGTDDSSPVIPGQFELSQNYPNPFNAQTMIQYSIPVNAHVQVEIFNILGQRIDDLADADQAAGEHQIAWNATNQTSGVFFYRVNVDGVSKTGRMELLK
jgi:plastocyanin